MAINLTIPSAGESVTEVTLLRWTKNAGEYVRRDEPIAEFETDKANSDLLASASGVLHPDPKKQAGYVAKVGEVVGYIDETAAAPAKSTGAASAAAPAAEKTKQPAASGATPPASQAPAAKAGGDAAAPSRSTDDLNPAVRRMVVENKVDPSTLTGTGPGGRLLKEDVQKALAERPAPAAGNGQPAPSTTPNTAPQVAAAPPQPIPARPPGPDLSKPVGEAPLNFDANGTARVPMTKIRKRIAANLVQAQQTAAILTTFNEIDLSAVSELRSRYKEKFEKHYGVGLGFMSFFARAVVLALREFPRVNAFLDGDDVVYHNYVNLGIAVSTDRGLTVPVLRNAEQMSFAKIESEIKRLANASREGKLGIPELSGGTFTITNGGVFGSLLSTPILLPPQSGILGMHAIQKRPIAVGERIEIRPMMYVALSYDHRVVDGRESVSFLVRVKEYLEDPARLMLEV
jgi:2-oxoglutarate dehydrogenase E2 component (dihydrolipoamide succinyltransferase)